MFLLLTVTFAKCNVFLSVIPNPGMREDEYCTQAPSKTINQRRTDMKARILFMGVLLLVSFSLIAAPAFAEKPDKSNSKAVKEQSQIDPEAGKEELKKVWEADKSAREEAKKANKGAEKQKNEVRKDVKEQSQIDQKADKEELKKAWEADKQAREEAKKADKAAKKQEHEDRKDAKKQKHDALKDAKQDREDAEEKAREDYKRAREDALEDYKGTK